MQYVQIIVSMNDNLGSCIAVYLC